MRSGVKAWVLRNMGAVFIDLPPGRNMMKKKCDKMCDK